MMWIIYVSKFHGTQLIPLPDDADVVAFCERLIIASQDHRYGRKFKLYTLWVPDFCQSKSPVVTEIA